MGKILFIITGAILVMYIVIGIAFVRMRACELD